ncbi:sigma-70 family RNA polymerase sigma factor [Aquabacterium sp.]|uniref:sigma-70 family RNA polymerase sigma factor n=1 Tax=Aquabacterium sp. TaxID=1872578 RepID=UPI002BD5B08A|nr:sigma-70 family RNA polymerase sigma factor [Aquabacterium sp.]HSW06372.1 sigma-70 family RNA polymerase sigma factor [Aquabacterium sp.]
MRCDPKASEEPPLVALWRRWCAVQSLEDRGALTALYTPYVRMLAAKCYANRISHELEFGDYLQFGMIGLLEAIDRFDPARGVKFETFASPRIHGAILNGVEDLSEIQKQVAVRRRARRERSASLAASSARGESALEQLAGVAIGLAIGFALEDSGMYATTERAGHETAYARIEMRQLRQQVAELVQRLPENERIVVHRHYFQQMQFDQVAESLGLTKGRISQIHKTALGRLRLLRSENASFSASL